ncbi:hypothetical protein GOP47_0024032 [Adiantum capillus-veneris]|uniref:DM2 domain-containing protein n=1 Tax=Adiantum capillus-veneris TaxID=13818 RepID=A0A9D4U5S0_ADICA|nr:hypothetical protein GOP47_0024032 [Adiantum capillus-veneris]
MASLSVPLFTSAQFGTTVAPLQRRALASKAVVAVGARSAPKAKPAAEAPKAPRGTGLKKPVDISPALQQFLGTQQASRADTMKLIWDYIKRNNLQSEADRRRIISRKMRDRQS